MTLSLQSLPAPNPRSADPEILAREIVDRLTYRVGKDPRSPSRTTGCRRSILVTRDRAIDHWMNATRATYRDGRKRVYYLSLEFLIGRLLRDAISQPRPDRRRCARRSTALGVDLDDIAELEPDAALGNGGLGRLAACFMESMATLGIPAYGYGIRYDHGLFRQEIRDGWQVELPEDWLAHGNPWEFERREVAYDDRLRRHGRVPSTPTATPSATSGTRRRRSSPSPTTRRSSAGAAQHVNTLRLWTAARRSTRSGSTPSTPATTSARSPSATRAESDHPRALSGRRHAGRPGAAAAPGVLLLLGLAAGPPAPAHAAVRRRSTTCPTRWRSSSTTPIRRSPSPS